jgi:diguanylate cyclase (GGDEF)-like protein
MKKLFHRLSIHYRLLFSYAITFLFLSTMGSLVIYSLIRTTLEQNIETELKNSTQAILGMVKTAIDASTRNHLRAISEKNRDIITHFYQQYQSGEISEKEAKEKAGIIILSQLIGKSGYIYCINSYGIIQVHPEKNLINTDLSDNEFIQLQKKQKEGYIEYDWANPGETGKRPKALYMNYFEPWDWIISVSSYRDEFKDFISVDDFRDNILSIKFGKTGYPYVMDSKGLLIIHPKLQGTNIYDSQDDNGRRFIREICEKKNGKIIYPWKNPDETTAREKLVIFNYIPELDWIVASSSYLKEFYYPLTTIRYSTFFTVLIMLLLIIPITWLISSRLAKPLQEMINVFEHGASADFSSRLNLNWGGEMGEVAKNYNRFIDTLESTRKQLERSNNELEKRVEERTLELSSWVKDLEQKNFESALLRTMSEMIQICNTSKEIYGVIQKHFIQFFPDTAGRLYVLEDDNTSLTSVLSWGNLSDSDIVFQKEDCWGLRRGKAYLMQESGNTPACSHAIGESAKETLCLPMIVREDVLGMLYIQSDIKEFLKSKQGLALTITEHLALALINMKLQETLKRQSIQDALTGLYNRRFLDESLVREQYSMKRHNYSIGIIMMDVDHFKLFNDNHGHECGDTILRELGIYLKENTRKNDIACRYGGEEFVIILIQEDMENTIKKAEKIHKGIQDNLIIDHEGTHHSITVSIGVAMCPDHDTKIETAIKEADTAMYKAKKQGRNQVVLAE